MMDTVGVNSMHCSECCLATNKILVLNSFSKSSDILTCWAHQEKDMSLNYGVWMTDRTYMAALSGTFSYSYLSHFQFSCLHIRVFIGLELFDINSWIKEKL